MIPYTLYYFFLKLCLRLERITKVIHADFYNWNNSKFCERKIIYALHPTPIPTPEVINANSLVCSMHIFPVFQIYIPCLKIYTFFFYKVDCSWCDRNVWYSLLAIIITIDNLYWLTLCKKVYMHSFTYFHNSLVFISTYWIRQVELKISSL